ncbi:MAG: hypothetical protein V4808_01015 [Pseudomonadota bacterium]
MKRNILVATALAGLFAIQPAHAQLTPEQLIDNAITQAKSAMDAASLPRVKVLLQRAANCLIGRDSGYFVIGAGGLCNSRINLTTSITIKQKRDMVTDAYNKLLAGSGQPDVQRAQDYAEDAIALLEEAKEAED